jgi:hypothetical protein
MQERRCNFTGLRMFNEISEENIKELSESFYLFLKGLNEDYDFKSIACILGIYYVNAYNLLGFDEDEIIDCVKRIIKTTR